MQNKLINYRLILRKILKMKRIKVKYFRIQKINKKLNQSNQMIILMKIYNNIYKIVIYKYYKHH